MILSRTPFRVTLGGGSTDLPSYYQKHGGFSFAMGLDKYMYVAINPPVVGSKIRVNYTRNEVVDNPDQLQHELAREALKRHGITSQMEITSMADLPAATGLGSSSCYLVGLLKCLRNFRRAYCSLEELAEEACEIEIDVLEAPKGKQDQYMAAFGGMTVLEIDRQGKVDVRSANIKTGSLADFVANTQMYWTGVQFSGDEVLRQQTAALQAEGGHMRETVEKCLHGIKETGYQTLEAVETENYDEFGRLMDVHWQYKKQMSPKISIPGIDQLYAEVKERFGVLGGKLSGAGGGGFFMVYAPGKHGELNEFMESRGLQRLHYNIDFEGVTVITNTPFLSGRYQPIK